MFNINTVLLLDVNKKKIILKRLAKFNLIYISANSTIVNKNVDLNLKLNNSPIIHYMLYTFVVNAYIYTKNCKNLI